jgi:hypothetical protein
MAPTWLGIKAAGEIIARRHFRASDDKRASYFRIQAADTPNNMGLRLAQNYSRREMTAPRVSQPWEK